MIALVVYVYDTPSMKNAFYLSSILPHSWLFILLFFFVQVCETVPCIFHLYIFFILFTFVTDLQARRIICTDTKIKFVSERVN